MGFRLLLREPWELLRELRWLEPYNCPRPILFKRISCTQHSVRSPDGTYRLPELGDGAEFWETDSWKGENYAKRECKDPQKTPLKCSEEFDEWMEESTQCWEKNHPKWLEITIPENRVFFFFSVSLETSSFTGYCVEYVEMSDLSSEE